MSAPVGWKSRFDVAVRAGRRRIVLHGNVLDQVLVDSDGQISLLPLVAWLNGELQRHGFERVLDYDLVSLPAPLFGPAPEEFARLDPRQQQDYASNPPPVLERLRRIMLAGPGPRTALIVRNAEQALDSPGKGAALLLNLGQEGRGPVLTQNLEIHLYNAEGGIPQDFIRSDPECEAILVPSPRYDERLAYFRSLHADTHRILRLAEEAARVTPDRLARVTEGFRLAEVLHLERLAESSGAVELRELLNEFRFGRRHENFRHINVPQVKASLRKVLRGQDYAIGQIEDSLYIAKHKVAGIVFEKSSRLPGMVLFFVGATGVGKTLMARTICEAVTGTVENLKIFDMTEYQQDHAVQRFIGPPPGYVGYAEGGQLTNWVRERPFSVVLIDEVEKAHDRILDIFMQILEGARLTDGRGVTVDFSETMLVFTSNIGATAARDLQVADRVAVENYFKTQVEQYFREHLGRPELFNRMKQGGIVVFDFIDEAAARRVVEEKLQQIAADINEKLRTAQAAVVVDANSFDHQNLVDNLLRLSRFQEYGLRSVNNEVMQRAGAGIGRFLDSPRPGAYHFAWRADVDKVAIVRHGDSLA